MTFLLGCKLDGVGEKRLAFIEDAETISPLSLAQSIRGSADVQLDWGVTQMVADALTKPSRLSSWSWRPWSWSIAWTSS